MSFDYAAAGDLLERYGRAWEAFDGDAWVELFTHDVEYHADPFEEPLIGRNAVRAYLRDAASRQGEVDFTVERHWFVDPTVLAAWHAAYLRQADRARVRLIGFMTLEMRDGRIARLREWYHRRETPAG
ncbi:MAG TPA: nuclear transport factor 2 family protein [Candidatus Limnocylindrales bacterium]|nr:nuclear transport factor 2 family protein [Candidatus Limnocylindrales bacterium]